MALQLTVMRLAALTVAFNIMLVFFATVIWMLSSMRRVRLAYSFTLDQYAPATIEQHSAARVPEAHQYAEPLPDQWRIPVQPGNPDDIVILIEPEDKAYKRTVERLITHFKANAS